MRTKMDYCCSGTEYMWYGNWNRHVCHTWECEVDRPSRSTGVNPVNDNLYQLHLINVRDFCPQAHFWRTRESKRAHATKFYGRLWLVPSVLRASLFSVLKLIQMCEYTTHFDLKLIRHFGASVLNFLTTMCCITRLLLRCIHHFKSDYINNMDHMRILGTEPSSVIHSQTK